MDILNRIFSARDQKIHNGEETETLHVNRWTKAEILNSKDIFKVAPIDWPGLILFGLKIVVNDGLKDGEFYIN